MPESRIDIARAALHEITGPESVGAYLGEESVGEGVVNLLFGASMLGYPGWRWTVSLAVLEGEEPTILETELIPSEGALLAPDWVPWVDRMDDYLAAQAAIAEAEAAAGEIGDELDEDDELGEDDLDDDEDDELPVLPLLHGGDIDGVDIDPDDELDDEIELDDDDDDGDDLDDAGDPSER